MQEWIRLSQLRVLAKQSSNCIAKGFAWGYSARIQSEIFGCFWKKRSYLNASLSSRPVSVFSVSRRVLRKRSLAPADVIYVGDETRDMEAARRNKVTALAVCWGANGREAMENEDPDLCIDDPADLLRCAKKVEAES